MSLQLLFGVSLALGAGRDLGPLSLWWLEDAVRTGAFLPLTGCCPPGGESAAFCGDPIPVAAA